MLTGLLLAHLRRTGVRALAMKPICAGSRDDAKLLFELNDREVPMESVNPFFFRKPLAPLLAARLARRHISLQEIMARIDELQKRCELLVIEGAGGLLVPLGKRFMIIDLIARLHCSVILAARNGIGVINHVLLSASALGRRGQIDTSVVLMGKPDADISAESNSKMLRELLCQIDVFEVPFISENLHSAEVIRGQARSRKKLMTKIAAAKAMRAVLR
ncbi:MAG: dethiobiotin synthase [Verrucomicrobiales bacterium]|nr:dethiobiotin synthase [Verrucomicrobiales bacterium]